MLRDVWLRRMGISWAPWPPRRPTAPPASPGAVGVLADEQHAPRGADRAVGLVAVVIVQEEAVQEPVLREGPAGPVPFLLDRGLTTPPSAPRLPCTGHTSLPQTAGAACAPGSFRSRCTCLKGQRSAMRVTTPSDRVTASGTHLTKELRDRCTENYTTSLRERPPCMGKCPVFTDRRPNSVKTMCLPKPVYTFPPSPSRLACVCACVYWQAGPKMRGARQGLQKRTIRTENESLSA